MVDFILKHLKELLVFTGGIVVAVLTTRYKEGIKKGTNFVIDSLLSWVRIRFLMLRRYKNSIIRSYREIKVGYRNLRLDIERHYIALKIHSFVHFKQKEADEEIRTKKLEVLEVLKKHRHLVILGAPGAGKTTLMQWLLLKYAHGQMKKELGEKLIPIFITLRSLESGQSVDDLITIAIKYHHLKGAEEYIRNQMRKGNCLLIFDGMDEIVDEATRQKFIKSMNTTYGLFYRYSRIIITSRIEGYPTDPFDSSFREHEILDLSMEQVEAFVNGILASDDEPDRLIRQIKENEGLKKFAANPLMLSLLTFVYQQSYHKLPNDRVRVYKRCMQLMLEDRDKAKGIDAYRNKYELEDKEFLLRKFAYDFSLKNKWEFTEKEILEHWKNNLPANLKEDDLKKMLKEICIANGILKHLSANLLTFFHRTFQEYYAAKEICKREHELLGNILNSEIFDKLLKKEWQEITLFIVGMLDDASQLVYQLCLKGPHLSLQCLVYSKRLDEDIISDLIWRILNKLETTNILDVHVRSDFVYLAYRYGLSRIINYLSIALKQLDKENTSPKIWQVIDHVMLAFSPQKGMVYVSSGDYQWGKRPKGWIPGIWIDIYPVTNSSYQKWIKTNKIKDLPCHWVSRQHNEPLVTPLMSLLPIVDITYDDAFVYSVHLNKRLPNEKEWRIIEKIGNESGKEGLLNESKVKYLKRNKLEKSFSYYRAFAGARDLAHDLARARSLGYARSLGRARDLARDLARAHDLAHSLGSACDLALPFGFRKMKGHFEVVNKAAQIIEEELNKSKSWTKKAWEQTFELGKALVDALVVFLEILTKDVPGDLLKALREPGLLTPVNEFPPNSLGICGLVGNVWEWTSTKNKKGEHLICGGAWTEEKFDPDREEWRPTDWRDINLGFRCVCDWDKIFDVKTPEEVAESPEGSGE